MNTTLKLVVAGACALGTAFAANAQTSLGSVALSLNNVKTTPSESYLYPFSNSISFTFTNGMTTSDGTGDLAGIKDGETVSGSTTFVPSSSNGGSGTPFTLAFDGMGSFVETSAPTMESNAGPTSTASSVDFLLLGTFQPTAAGTAAGVVAGPASIDISFTENGTTGMSGTATFSSSGTLSSTASVTPEPSSLILLGTGLAGFAGVLRRRTLGK